MSEQEKPETHADIIAEMRERKSQLEDAIFNAPLCYSTDNMRAKVEILDEFLNRLEAAHERECATAEKSSAVGDSAKLREALENCANMGEQIDYQLGSSDETVYAFRHERCLAHNISECARAALAKPPRNCDRFATVDEARKAHEEYCRKYIMRASNKFDFPMEFDAWLLAPATEKEGGAK